MTWDSIYRITVADLAVSGMAVALLITALRQGLLRDFPRGTGLVLTGIALVGIVYGTDLLLLISAPLFGDATLAAQAGEFMSTEARWLAALASTPLLFVGFQRINRERAQADDLLRRVTDALPIGIAYLDAEEHVLLANRLYGGWHQKPLEAFLGYRFKDIVPSEMYDIIEPQIRRVLSGRAVSFDSPLSHRDPDVPLDLHAQLVPDTRDDGSVVGFHVLITDITERNRLEREVVTAGERERNAIGRDLHDNLGQILTGTSLSLQALSRTLAKENSAHTDTVNDLRATVQTTIDRVRELTRILAPAFEQGDLARAIEALAEEVRRLFRIECDVDCAAARIVTDSEAATHLYRIVQESITNAARHGKANRVRIRCQSDAVWFRIEIIDDGIGIELDEQSTYGMGLNTMRYRSKMISGYFQIQPGADGGTRVTCTCPVRMLTADADDVTTNGEEIRSTAAS